MSENQSMKNNVQLSLREETMNSVTHGVMAASLLIAYPYAAISGYLKGGVVLAVGVSVFIISLFLMFLGSTLYHAMSYDTKHKYVFRVLDHVFIFVAIAGSFTPIALYVIGGPLGYAIVALQWTAASIGILYKALAQTANAKVMVTIFLLMGWSAVLLMPTLIKNSSPLFIFLIGLGGVFYSVGTYFYMQKDKQYYHAIWHVFINLASISHFIAIVFVM